MGSIRDLWSKKVPVGWQAQGLRPVRAGLWWGGALFCLLALTGCQALTSRGLETPATTAPMGVTPRLETPEAAPASPTTLAPGQATGFSSATPALSPAPPRVDPTPYPTATELALPLPTANPRAPILRIHRSGVYCLSGPGGEYPVVQFFLPVPGYPFYSDPAGLTTVDYHYRIIARHFNTHPNSRGWWWKIDRGQAGEECWVKQYPAPVDNDIVLTLLFMSVSGDIERVPEE